ncbi:MAG: FAD-binding oxidoreductase [candidate division Zixibacteria bacterium]|nr:FAD-binding oxidoreductase [candidate division Zixibacteria bacterium]
MSDLDNFLDIVRNDFPEDRLTYQKSVPTFHPETAAEAGKLFEKANKAGQKLYINGFGNIIEPDKKQFENILVVKSDRFNRLIKTVAGDYYIEVGAGYPLNELNSALEKDKFFLPHANLPYVGSIGGALAIGLSADYSGVNLPISKYFIGAEIVDPQGNVINPGSVCFKSVSGLDIVRIFSPSWGILGMLISATFRVMPTSELPEYQDMKMHSIDHDKFVSTYNNPGDNNSALYSIKIKEKFDPNGILPLR